MLQFLIDVLSPIFEGMGVASTDVVKYVNMLAGYIYAILGTGSMRLPTPRPRLAT